MKRLSICAAIALIAPILLSSGAEAAAPRTYDCTKAGNANKVACKGVAPAAASKATPLAPATAKPRSYDCTKPGNANKAACKGAGPAANAAMNAAPAASAVSAAPAKPRNYDCTKPGNANKAACKSLAPTPASPPSPAVVARPPMPATPPARPAAAAAPPQTPAPVQQARPATATAGGSRIVEWTTKTGKLVHYDCSKAGNFNKQACKR